MQLFPTLLHHNFRWVALPCVKFQPNHQPMKHILTLALAAMTSFGFSQDLATFRKHELGINSTHFLQNFLNLGSGTSATLNPYLFTYRYCGQNFALRSGLGLMTSSLDEDDPNSNSSTKQSARDVDFRLGAEWRKQLNQRWRTNLGFDVHYGQTFTSIETTSGFDNATITDNLLSYGFGPVWGIQFDINDRLRLFTETSFTFTTWEQTEKSEFSSNPQFDEEQKTSGTGSAFTLPTNIYFAITL